ncbi:N-acylneuraminate-9-phosphatase [Callorhinchus milii]|uniref:N-acetylneuraminic acid phosphatase n=2 Tax=Callorhinchus milii TaxID=7868 RepID=A0A4W3J7V0_CALMI|nr:N-acylneuraminate-9-phosphatase [Callorhinchus milii]|eukprot:gi/632952909/ref/XP_007892111.1/ PREDICTED: N-acylneuraminate-9-phosphatase [Callorhinchus milii]
MAVHAGSGVRALLFDLDDTLIATTRASHTAEREVKTLLKFKYRYEDSAADTVIQKFNTKLKQHFESSMKQDVKKLRQLHFEQAIQETKGGEPDPVLASECYSLWRNTRLQHIHFTDEVKAMLTALRQSYKLLLLTNGPAEVQREKIEACSCQQYFDAIIVGGEYPEQKPARSIFQECWNILGVKPEACVMVGDNLNTDIQGGVNAGLCATIWINPTNQKPKGDVIPDYSVMSVLDVVDILKKL